MLICDSSHLSDNSKRTFAYIAISIKSVATGSDAVLPMTPSA